MLRTLSVRTRFLLVIAAVTASLLALGLWGAVSSRSSLATTSELFERSARANQEVGALREALSNLRRYESQMVAVSSANPTAVEDYVKLWKREQATLKGAGERLAKAHEGDAQIAALIARQSKLVDEYALAVGPIAAQLQAAQIDGAVALAYMNKAEPIAKNLQSTLVSLLKAQQASEADLQAQMARGVNMAATLRLALVAATLALFVPLMWLTLRSVCGPLEEAVQVASRVATGDLSTSWSVRGHDEPARLMRALQQMQEALRSLVGEVRGSAESIEVASTEVASGNLDLSHRTELAASNLQQAASSMEQLTGTVKHSAEAAAQANELASSASQVASRGGDVVNKVVTTMDEISASSKKIADIIGVIDGIAFQTNILALNAAVEAARAGEQGRGFAVVAGEVRSLAQRSAQAAKEIKSLIGASVDSVASGSRLVKDAGSTMTDIVASVKRVTDIIGEITSASTEQSSGIGQINSAVTDLDHMTQQNAALVEQSAAAAESLKEQATKLSGVVSRFKLQATV